MGAMGRTGTKKLRIKQENFELELEREESLSTSGEHEFPSPSEVLVQAARGHEPKQVRNRASDIPASLTPPLDHADEAKKEAPGKFVTSPMVGTFYSSPGPDEPHFIQVGDKITKDTVVCIIEAMKVMNEVKSGVEGVVSAILVENGHPVEFGTKLFKIS